MSTTTDRDPLDVLAEEFVARLRAGNAPDIDDYAARHPDHAAAIRELFPTLLAMEALKPGEATLDHAPSRATRSQVPARLGEFRIVREIGRGGMGVVYEAVQEPLGRHVALKVLPGELLADERRLERFRREAKAAARLHHTNIVPVYGTGTADGVHYYAMQYIAGQSLDRVVQQRQSVPPMTVARLGVQAASALAHAHAQGVLHRDIKPANLLLDDHGTLWVADFGLAKLTDEADLTGAGDILGTLRYMAPERFAGQCDERADIYALGLTLYELLTLRPAFDESAREKLVTQVTQGRPPAPRTLNPAIPRDLETIILKATAREPEARYQTAADLADDLQRFVEDRPIRARRASVPERLWRWARRNPLVASLTATAAVLLVAATVSATLTALAYRELADQRGELIDQGNRAYARWEAADRHANRRDWPAALAALDEAIALSPEHTQVWSDRGSVYLRLGLADRAAADFAQLFEVRRKKDLLPNEPAWWYFQAALRWHQGDAAGYRETCRAMRQHFTDAASPEVVRALVLACTLAPEGCAEPRDLVRCVDEAAERHPAGKFAGLRVAALYRAGAYRDVVTATNPTGPLDRSQTVAALCFRAMSQAALGEREPALATLNAARDKLDATASVLSLQPFGPLPQDRFVGVFPPPDHKEGLAEWLRDDLLWGETTAKLAPNEPAHPLVLFWRARGCAALGWWDEADAATAQAQALRLGDVALVERAQLNAARGHWAAVAADLERAGPVARTDYPLAQRAAQLYTAFGRHADARRHLAEAVARTPGNLDLRLERGQASIKLGDWDDAAADLTAILNDPRWQPPRQFRKGIGGGAIFSFFPEWHGTVANAPAALGDPRQSVREQVARHDELYARVSAKYPNDRALRRERGRFLLAAQRWDDAVAFYADWMDALRKGFGDPFAMNALATEFADEVAPWEPVYAPLVARFPAVHALRVARCNWLVRAGDIQRAADVLSPVLDAAQRGRHQEGYSTAAASAALFQVLLARRPDDAELWLARFHERLAKNDLPSAEAAADAVARLQPGNATYLARLAADLWAHPERAARFLRQAIRLQPDAPSLRHQLFQNALAGKRWDEAATEFGEAQRCGAILTPAGKPQVSLGDLYALVPLEAEPLGELARRRPDDGGLWLRYARKLATTPQLAEALAAFEKAAALLPTSPDVWTDLARVQLRLKKWDEASASLDTAVQRAAVPNPTGLTANAVYQALGLWPEAFAELSQRRPTDGRLWLAHARNLANARKVPEAIAAFEKAGELLKTGEIWPDLARLHIERKNWKEAARAFDRGLNALPPVPFTLAGQPGPQPAQPNLYPEIVGRSFAMPDGKALFSAVAEARPNDGRLWLEYCRYLRTTSGGPRLLLDAELRQGLDELVQRAPKEPIAWLERAAFRSRTGEFDKAADDYAAAADLLPRDLPQPQHPQGRVHFQVYSEVIARPELFERFTARRKDDPLPWFFRSFRQTTEAAAVADLDRALQVRPEEARFQVSRRSLRMAFGSWQEAAAGYVEEMERAEPPPHAFIWVETAAVLAAAGRADDYRVHCRRMVRVWDTPEKPADAQLLAWACGLLPDSGVPAQRLLDLAEPARQAEPLVAWNAVVAALARCRLGQYAQAGHLLRERLGTPTSPQDRALLEFLLALALAHDGKKDEARTYYDAGVKRTESATQLDGQRRRMSPGHAWAAVEVLRREAADLLGVAP